MAHPQPLPQAGGVKSLGEFPQRALAPRHHLARDRHLRLEIGLGRSQLDPARGGDQRQRFTDRRTEVRQHILGQDDPGGVANLGDLDGGVHTGVITRVSRNGNRAAYIVIKYHVPGIQSPRNSGGYDDHANVPQGNLSKSMQRHLFVEESRGWYHTAILTKALQTCLPIKLELSERMNPANILGWA